MDLSDKFETRSTKIETNPKYEGSNFQNIIGDRHHLSLAAVWVIRILMIRNCFGFRYSNFEFYVSGIFLIMIKDNNQGRAALIFEP